MILYITSLQLYIDFFIVLHQLFDSSYIDLLKAIFSIYIDFFTEPKILPLNNYSSFDFLSAIIPNTPKLINNRSAIDETINKVNADLLTPIEPSINSVK